MTAKRKPAKRTAARSHGVTPLEQVKHLTGLEFLQGIVVGKYPAPPIGAALKFRMVEMEFGRAVFEGEPDEGFYNPIGSVHGGYAATLLDSCMGCAVHTALAAGQAYTTLEFKINFVRPMSHATGTVRAEGRVIHAGSRVATVEGYLYDAKRKLLAHATSTCLVFPV
jgi:uncharacterized protein (TIGR00369 family)